MQALVARRRHRRALPSIVARARELGLLITRAGDDAIRFLPPLNCTNEEIDEAVRIMGQAAG